MGTIVFWALCIAAGVLYWAKTDGAEDGMALWEIGVATFVASLGLSVLVRVLGGPNYLPLT